jgi:hypothetical protein
MCASGIKTGICLDVTGISGEAFASHQTFGHAALKNSLKHMAETQQLRMFPSCTCISTVGLLVLIAWMPEGGRRSTPIDNPEVLC